MGVLARIRDAVATSRTLGLADQTPIRSPFSPTTLTRIAWSDFHGDAHPRTIGRAEAMRVPSIAKGRALICGTLSRQPLAKYRYDKRVSSDKWMTSTSSDVSPQVRMLWTIDDLIFSGCSLWAVERDRSGQITDAIRVPPQWWTIDEGLGIRVNGEPVSASEVIYFEGPQEGLTEIARSTIEGALAIEDAWRQRVQAPVPIVNLHPKDQFDLEPDEIDQLISQWEKARRNGGTAYTSAGIEAEFPQVNDDSQLFIEGRNAIRLDVANFLNLPGRLLDGTTATASLTYSTQEGSRNELVDLSLAYWATPIEQRLSMDDVTAKGTSIQFDISYLSTPTQPTKGPNVED